jgi:oligopeptide/dipeptide ABC transporter ATP-binding protein
MFEQDNILFSQTIFNFFTIPLFHSSHEGKHHPCGVKSKSGPLGQDSLLKKYPHELSGGMLQRVMIAMALSCRPELLIADEPATALDVTIQAQILTLMLRLRSEIQSAIVLITHDLGVVAEICDSVAIMYAGHIVEQGRAEDIFSRPRHPYTEGLMDSIPGRNPEREDLRTIKGLVPDLIHPPTGCRIQPRCPLAPEACRREKPFLEDLEDGHAVACHLR